MIARICLLAAMALPHAFADTEGDLKAILKRLDQLEQDNRELRDQVKSLLERLSERSEVQEHRTEELAQTKVEASQKMPLSLTGMLLFNAFDNGSHGGAAQDPVTARLSPGAASAGGTVRQTVLGLKFNGPELPGGGNVTGSLYMDFFAGSRDADTHVLRIRTGTLDFNWKNTTLTIAQDKPIFAPREPDSLAQVWLSPLTAAGNLWDWQPQVRVEQRFHFGEQTGLRAQAGVYQTAETEAIVPSAFANSLEFARPAYQGRVEFWHGDRNRRFEIAPGFHFSSTHVAGATVPSRLASLDWLIRPVALVEVTGAWFKGENVAGLGSLRQGFTILGPGRAIPVHSQGGWAQLALFATPRLTLHFYGGQEHDRGSDLSGGGITRNFVYAGNVFYRLAPNVLASFEVSQTRTTYLLNGLRLNNHYDLALAYLF